MGKINYVERQDPFTVWVSDDGTCYEVRTTIRVFRTTNAFFVEYVNGDVAVWKYLKIKDPTTPKHVQFEHFWEIPENAVFRWKEKNEVGTCAGIHKNGYLIMSAINNFGSFKNMYIFGEMSLDRGRTWGPAGKVEAV